MIGLTGLGIEGEGDVVQLGGDGQLAADHRLALLGDAQAQHIGGVGLVGFAGSDQEVSVLSQEGRGGAFIGEGLTRHGIDDRERIGEELLGHESVLARQSADFEERLLGIHRVDVREQPVESSDGVGDPRGG